MTYFDHGGLFLIFNGLAIYFVIINSKTNRCTGNPGKYFDFTENDL